MKQIVIADVGPVYLAGPALLLPIVQKYNIRKRNVWEIILIFQEMLLASHIHIHPNHYSSKIAKRQ